VSTQGKESAYVSDDETIEAQALSITRVQLLANSTMAILSWVPRTPPRYTLRLRAPWHTRPSSFKAPSRLVYYNCRAYKPTPSPSVHFLITFTCYVNPTQVGGCILSPDRRPAPHLTYLQLVCRPRAEIRPGGREPWERTAGNTPLPRH
jgi:hypothetical protein